MLCYHLYFYREKIKCKLDGLTAVEFSFKGFTKEPEIITGFLGVKKRENLKLILCRPTGYSASNLMRSELTQLG